MKTPIDDARARVVAIALAELGPGGLACEQDPQKYIRDAAPQYIGLTPNAKAWCGIFWLWCLRQAGLTSRLWVDGKGFALGYLPITTVPEPGDGAYFGPPLHHYAVVRWTSESRVYTVDGNALTSPREGVTARDYTLKSVGCFFSIAPLLPGR